ncbi:protein Lines homolog 1 isoform X2 [Chelonia mydas]|uniref:protein Lines homolog 1 isoform X2 n=2 Tax=Chelonia mydas TaxID=8469 RepID=UPI0018A21456|nr:protein Lines homolog 1 isoform X2 [Chelonia mydas]XP_043379279.1 protein Lines homolog 1 isoform X2 [Chelonia mydas]XP_043379280.1 protein Lines homolog 1 isoform X2 [Chelonia mydas]
MGDLSPLQELHRDVLIGTSLTKDSHDYAFFLNPHVSPQDSSTRVNESHNQICLESPNWGTWSHQDSAVSDALALVTDDKSGSFANTNSSMFCSREMILLQLTLIKMMIAKVQSQETEFSIRQKYLDIITILLKETKIDSKLICLCNTSDKLLSHMASKSIASLVYFQLKKENTFNVTWLTFCLKTLSEFPKSDQVAECLWILRAIIRDILKDKDLHKADILKNVFTPLDTVLEGFYNSILSHHCNGCQGTSLYSKAANNLIEFIDFLDVLVTSRIQLESHFKCQRILFLNTSYILDLTYSSVHYLIKKKSIMLLKKCILYKAGEDFVSGSLPTLSLQDPYLNKDMLALANVVLQAVNLGWLNQIPVSEKASYFGGSEAQPEDGIHSGPDQVILRALSLVLLKALEIKVQNSTKAAEIKDLQSFMSQLLIFLKKHLKSSQHFHPNVHPCEWLSMVFIEQDDDMLEAAKSLLTVYLKFDRLWHDDAGNLCIEAEEDETWIYLTHESGCNPHCIFLFFLKSIAFDSTVLLDFLISSETCFLEYFVRYLKLLREDWHHFVNISNCFDIASKRGVCVSFVTSSHQEKKTCLTDESLENACSDPVQHTLVSLASSQKPSVPMEQQGDDQVVKPNKPNSLIRTDNTSALDCLQSLVNYDSSEDSELESVGKECLANMKQMPSNNQGSTKIRETVCMDADDKPHTLEPKVLPLKQKSSNPSSLMVCNMSPNIPVPVERMLLKSMTCLEELQKAISRLQRRNLFPYNPAALLKLLRQSIKA